MHVVPIRASSPQLIEHRLSGHQAPNLYMNDYTFNRASSPQLCMDLATNATTTNNFNNLGNNLTTLTTTIATTSTS